LLDAAMLASDNWCESRLISATTSKSCRQLGSRRIAVGSHGGDAVAERPGSVSAEIGLLKIPFITGQTIQVNGGAQYY
jgi:hypothetical protein